MPANPPYAKILFRVNGGALQSDSVTIAAGDVLHFQAESTVAWGTARWEFKYPDEAWPTPAGWTRDTDNALVYFAGTAPTDITMPNPGSGGVWGKWSLNLLVNGGGSSVLENNVQFSLPSVNGFTGVGVDEDNQFHPGMSWPGAINKDLRTLDAISTVLLAGAASVVLLSGTGTGPAGAFAIGDVVCSANDTDRTKVKLATAANLASADPASLQVMIQTGDAGDTKQAAGIGTRVAASAFSFVTPGAVASAGTTPPVLTLTGTATVPYELQVECTTSGARGAWKFRWSKDRGVTWMLTDVLSAATVALTGTGLTLNIATGNAATNNVWTATNGTDAVLNTTTGRAFRGTKRPAEYTIGTTDPQGNTTVAPLAPGHALATTTTRGNVLAYNGTNIHSRPADKHSIRDHFPYDGYNGSATADQSAVYQEFLDFVCKSGGTKVGNHDPRTDNGLPLRIATMLTNYDDTDGGLAREWNLHGGIENARSYGGSPQLINAMPSYAGTAATLVSRYTGSGTTDQSTQLWTLGTGTGVTVALKETFIGRRIQIWGTADVLNEGWPYIVGVPADDQVVVAFFNNRAAWPATDANSGSVKWRIMIPMLDIRAGGFRVRGMAITTATTATPFARRTHHIEVGYPFRAGAFAPNDFGFYECNLSAAASNVCDFGIVLAFDYVPRGGSGYTDAATYPGRNGNGDLQVVQATQVDESFIRRCKFTGFDKIGILHSSSNGQSKNIDLEEITWAQGGRPGSHGAIGYGVPRVKYSAGPTWGSDGNPHVRIARCKPASIDTMALFGGPSSGGIKSISHMYNEACYRLFINPGTQDEIVSIDHFQAVYAGLHPSGEIGFMAGEGPLRLDTVHIQQTDTTVKGHFVISSPTSKTGCISLTACVLQGTTGWTGRRGRTNPQARRGPYCLTSGDDLTFKVQGGTTRTIKITTVNLARAGMTSGIDYNEIESWQLGRLFQGAARGRNVAYEVGAVVQTATGRAASPPVTYICTVAGTTANVGDPSAGWTTTIDATQADGGATFVVSEAFDGWGEYDNFPPSLQSGLDGITSTIQIVDVAGNLGGVIAVKVGFTLLLRSAGVQSQLCIDTNGWFDIPYTAGTTVEPVSVDLCSSAVLSSPNSWSGTHTPFPQGAKRYGITHAIYNPMCSVASGSFTAAAGGANCTFKGGSVTAAVAVAGANVTISDPRASANAVIHLTGTNALGAVLVAGGYQQGTITPGTSFVITFTAAIAGTETINYTIAEPT